MAWRRSWGPSAPTCPPPVLPLVLLLVLRPPPPLAQPVTPPRHCYNRSATAQHMRDKDQAYIPTCPVLPLVLLGISTCLCPPVLLLYAQSQGKCVELEGRIKVLEAQLHMSEERRVEETAALKDTLHTLSHAVGKAVRTLYMYIYPCLLSTRYYRIVLNGVSCVLCCLSIRRVCPLCRQ
jgi:hypothetical protein